VKNLEERLKYAKLILREVSCENLGRTALCKRFVQASGSPASFDGLMRFLVRNGFVEKSGSRHRAPYRLTERGRRFLEGLQ
jgi:predicted transcriptional regulator